MEYEGKVNRGRENLTWKMRSGWRGVSTWGFANSLRGRATMVCMYDEKEYLRSLVPLAGDREVDPDFLTGRNEVTTLEERI